MAFDGTAQEEPVHSVTSPAQSVSISDSERVEASQIASTLSPLPIWPLLRSLASVIVPLAVLLIVNHLLVDRSVDLITFLLAIVATASLAGLVWRLHALYLLIDGQRRRSRGLPQSPGPDPLLRLAALPIWSDLPIRWLLIGALVSNMLVFAYVSSKYATLPPFLPLHYSATGDVDRLGTPPEVFIIPTIGVVVMLSNLLVAAALYRRERLSSLLLSGASIFVQLVLLVATANIVSRA